LRDGKIVAVNEYMDTELITAVFAAVDESRICDGRRPESGGGLST
jgi:hypothetical protein